MICVRNAQLPSVAFGGRLRGQHSSDTHADGGLRRCANREGGAEAVTEAFLGVEAGCTRCMKEHKRRESEGGHQKSGVLRK